MQTILIACKSEFVAQALVEELGRNYTVHTCFRGDTAAALLESIQPDMLIIDLFLPYVDGLTVLRERTYAPPHILALTNLATDAAVQSAWDAGADWIMLIPCSCKAIAAQAEKMLCTEPMSGSTRDPQARTRQHLDRLGIPRTRSGYRRLQIGVPLYAQDPEQSLHKELYPIIGQLCGNENWQQVESAIRTLIHKTWETRDSVIWEIYFPGLEKPPSNRVFLAELAKRIQEKPSPED